MRVGEGRRVILPQAGAPQAIPPLGEGGAESFVFGGGGRVIPRAGGVDGPNAEAAESDGVRLGAHLDTLGHAGKGDVPAGRLPYRTALKAQFEFVISVPQIAENPKVIKSPLNVGNRCCRPGEGVNRWGAVGFLNPSQFPVGIALGHFPNRPFQIKIVVASGGFRHFGGKKVQAHPFGEGDFGPQGVHARVVIRDQRAVPNEEGLPAQDQVQSVPGQAGDSKISVLHPGGSVGFGEPRARRTGAGFLPPQIDRLQPEDRLHLAVQLSRHIGADLMGVII